MSDRARHDSKAHRTAETGMHPAAIEITLGAVVWFILVTWVSFARGPHIDWDLTVITLFLAFFFALLLLMASHAGQDARWHLRQTSFRQFLQSQVGTATGSMRGRDALIEIAILPVALALGATAIGLAWIALH